MSLVYEYKYFALDVCYPCFYVNCAFTANFAEIRLPFNEVEGLGDFFRASNDSEFRIFLGIFVN